VADIQSRLATAGTAVGQRAPDPARARRPIGTDRAAEMRRPAPASSLRRLVAEVARLEAELAQARAQVAALAATADVDPLTECSTAAASNASSSAPSPM
jgi:hypothetical protein